MEVRGFVADLAKNDLRFSELGVDCRPGLIVLQQIQEFSAGSCRFWMLQLQVQV